MNKAGEADRYASGASEPPRQFGSWRKRHLIEALTHGGVSRPAMPA
jgi:hypothetical protein